jgi:hypothetical protein
MVLRFRTFVQVLIAFLVLATPQATCGAGASDGDKTCCCTASKTCECLRGTPCQQTCTLTHVQAIDKQVPARSVDISTLHGHLLFAIALTPVHFAAVVPAFHPRVLNASPPFGGRQPQARLCLWLI